MATHNKNGVSDKKLLIELIKASGEELKDRAEDLIGEVDLITNFSIYITFSQPIDGSVPTIKIIKECVSKNAFGVIIDSLNEKGETNE